MKKIIYHSIIGGGGTTQKGGRLCKLLASDNSERRSEA
jgi:hypothetical protein